MWSFRRKNLILSFALLMSVFLTSCSVNSKGTGPGDSADSAESGNSAESAKGSEVISSAVDFDHELDGYEPKKDHYNFYFTYKLSTPGGMRLLLAWRMPRDSTMIRG